MLVFVQWLADQREAQAFVPPPSLGEESMAVGWDPRSCWDCDSIAPVARLLFFGVLGILFWVGVRLDRRPANHWNMVLILVLAAAGYVGAAIYTSRSAIVALLFITLAAVLGCCPIRSPDRPSLRSARSTVCHPLWRGGRHLDRCDPLFLDSVANLPGGMLNGGFLLADIWHVFDKQSFEALLVSLDIVVEFLG
jgi:hypothetical protein